MLNDDAERKIRALLERANHPGTPPHEAEAALAMAYRLMMKYDFDIRTLQASDAERSHSGRLSRDGLARGQESPTQSSGAATKPPVRIVCVGTFFVTELPK